MALPSFFFSTILYPIKSKTSGAVLPAMVNRMANDPFCDAKIVESWAKNVDPWTASVRGGRIESRRLVTDQAIIKAVLSRKPRSVLDIGCGEGWLARELAAQGLQVMGVDAIPGLIAEARRAGGGDFRIVSYEEIAAGALAVSVDVLVGNFSLLGDTSVEGLFRAAPTLLKPGGAFIVQTLHPVAACGDLPYQNGWRKGSWAGFNSDFTDPAPWYFRTLGSWVELFTNNGFRLLEIREPLHPTTRQLVSLLLTAVVSG